MRYLAAASALAAAAAGSPADWPARWTTFPRATPSQGWPDGPIVGNGNQGVSVGGAPGALTLYGTIHGFWSNSLGSNSTMPPLARAPLGFPSCPGPTCNITVGLTLLRVMIAAPQLAGAGATWTAELDYARAAATVVLAGAGGASLTATVYAAATAQVSILELRNTGSAPLAVNVTAAVNDNIARVPTSASCADATGAPAACAAPPAVPGVALTKDANAPAAASSFPITAAAAVLPVAATGGAAGAGALPYDVVEPKKSWANGATVDTHTRGVTAVLNLPAGAAVTYAIAMAASEDPGVKPATPAAVVAARAAAVTPAALAPLRAAHEAWWVDYWARSAVALGGEPDTEAFWYASIYALGSGTRAGQPVMDLWSPWRTTDQSSWRSNPTMDYNEQALYSGVVASNHVDLSGPYYDMLDAAVAGGSPGVESAALGCPGGLHLSVDLAPFGLKLGVYGEPQAWGIRSNAVYAAVQHSYHWWAVDHADPAVLAWATGHAIPFLSGVAKFWQCYLTKTPVADAPDGYRYWSVGDCDGDEGCNLPPQEATNPTWTIAYLRRLLETLPSMVIATGGTVDPAWADMLTHLPPTPTTTYRGVPILSAYGEGAVNQNATALDRQPGYLHSLWPGEALSPLSEPNATLAAAALNVFNFTPWTQDNSFSWMYASAARAGVPPDEVLRRWRAELIPNLKTNRLVAFGGLCSDSLGAVAFVHDMLVQSQEGFLRLFPAWPGNASASFTTLRMRGALLVSAAYVGRPEWAGRVASRTGGTANVTVLAEAGGAVRFLSPWVDAPTSTVRVVDATTGGAVAVTWSVAPGASGGPLGAFDAARASEYVISLAA